MNRRPWVLYTTMAFGYAFLYIPIMSVIAFSFNKSRLVTVWGGFSVEWYGKLFQNEQILSAAWRSFLIACSSASVAVVVGTAAGLTLARFGRFRGRGLLSLMNSAPLVMPEVMLGLSALLFFVFLQQLIGWPTRGMTTIAIAHITFSACYVTVIVRSRLSMMDDSLEEAAMDLGARPWKVFFLITLPLIAPALVAGWLLAFTLSLDDLVIASFTSGPGASTLPMVIYSKVKLGVTPEINALAALVMVLVMIVVSVAGTMLYRQQKAQER
ncbi:MAG TPA: ABC transporter permease subunit [Chiayiivirga sp.]|nr:ABC transporter permease subunit [Chiayiivirga sp.]